MSHFRPVDRQTAYLLPPSVDEWLPENHLAHFIVEVVDGLNLAAMEKLTRDVAALPITHPFCWERVLNFV